MQDATQIDDLVIVEQTVYLKTQNFIERLGNIQTTPVESEADVLSVYAALDELITDMRTFTQTLDDGPHRGTTGILYGNGFDSSVEVPEAAIAARTQGSEKPPAFAGASLS